MGTYLTNHTHTILAIIIFKCGFSRVNHTWKIYSCMLVYKLHIENMYARSCVLTCKLHKKDEPHLKSQMYVKLTFIDIGGI